jgi:hypothetical protein
MSCCVEGVGIVVGVVVANENRGSRMLVSGVACSEITVVFEARLPSVVFTEIDVTGLVIVVI